MKTTKIMILFIILSSFTSFASGEISFKKQNEKVKKEQQDELSKNNNNNKEPKKTTNKEKQIRKAILDTAFSQLNTKYIYGANGNGAYDCSSFVQYVYKKSLSINLPRVSAEQAEVGRKTSINQLKAGDLVTFNTLNKNRVSHIGIYVGNGEFIHASSGSKKVVVSELKGYYAEKFLFGVKII